MMVDATGARLAAHGVAYAPEIATAAKRHGIDPDLLAAIAAQETGGPDSDTGHNVVGDAGHGHGVFQIDDRWHAFARTPAAMDPGENADYAATMLSGLLQRYGGNVRSALSAYNAGSPTAAGTRTRWADGSDLGYADSVLRHYQRLTGSTPVAGSLAAGSPAAGDAFVDPAAGAQSSGTAPELAALIATLGALESSMAQAQPPAMSQPPAPTPYQPQTIDYGGVLDDQP